MTDTYDASNEFEYDIAFSFLKEDEHVAAALNDRLSDGLRTFLYSERQLEIAGTDGELKFGHVFGRASRLVVILYRPTWGTTPWTRIEETAIRNRGHEEGFDFVVLVSMDDLSKPRWIPQSRIWIGLKRFGIDGAAAILARRVSELGGDTVVETALSREVRLRRELSESASRERFQNSDKGVEEAKAEAQSVSKAVERLIDRLKESGSPLNIRVVLDRSAVLVVGGIAGLRIEWQGHYSNVLSGSHLDIQITRGSPRISTAMYWDDPPPLLHNLRYSAIGGDSLGFRWAQSSGDQTPLSSEAIADLALRKMFDEIERVDREQKGACAELCVNRA